MATVCYFSRLPYELRLYIWELTVEPRLVHLAQRSSFCPVQPKANQEPPSYLTPDVVEWIAIRHVKSKATVPAILHVSRDSRAIGGMLYEKTHKKVHDMLPADEQYYAYVNWAIDIITSEDGSLKELLNFRKKIRRLRIISRGDTTEWFYDEASLLSLYTSLQELFIVCPEGVMDWNSHNAAYSELTSWCKEEQVYLIEPDPSRRTMADQDGPPADCPLSRMARAMDVCAYSEKINNIMWNQNVSWKEAAGEAGDDYPFSGREPTLEMVLAQPPEEENRWQEDPEFNEYAVLLEQDLNLGWREGKAVAGDLLDKMSAML